jgi:hypothetical protein
MTLKEWVAVVQLDLDIELDLDVDEVLDLARDAAHEIARPAAPLTTFLVGYAAAQRGGGREAITTATEAVRRLIEADDGTPG